MSNYFPVHAHSEYSVLDGLGTVGDMVRKVSYLDQPGIALTDHGNMAGCIRLYIEAKKAGLVPFPGIEAYLVTDLIDKVAKEKRYHLGLLALDFKGYKALVRLTSRSHTRERFHRRPLIDLTDLKMLSKTAGKHVALTTGCYFGFVVQSFMDNDYATMERVIKKLASWFPHTFVELQDHGIHHELEGDIHDRDIASTLEAAADRLGLPVVLGQDSHYCEPSHQAAHDLMKDICYFGDTDDNRFPGGPFHLASSVWLRKRWTGQQWAKIEEGHAHLLELNKLKIPALDSYKFHVPEVSYSPDFWLKKRVKDGLDKKALWVWDHYQRRAKQEMKVFIEKGMSNYALLMYELCNWCRKEGIFIDVRGSANGSLVLYALGVTNVDPIKWDLSFDRFLSLDRQKPPDVDVDIESDRRDDVIAHIKSLYPSSVQIGTWGRIGFNADDDSDDRKGSIVVQYMAAKRKKVQNFNGRIATEDREPLEALAELDARKSAGAHAAGFVLPSASLPIEDYVPTMLIPSSGVIVTQPPMDDVEAVGFVKVDFLGQKSLTTFRKCVELLGKDPVNDGMEWIPDDDKEAAKLLRQGLTNTGIFQFDGFSTAHGGKKLGVANTYDAILALALFRPAMMASGMTDRYIEARKQKRRKFLHSGVDSLMADTWGVPVFQEQVLAIMRTVGLNADQVNEILKAVKASNDKIDEYAQDTFDRMYPIFLRCAIQNLQCTRDQAQLIWETVMKFSDYGFNKSHATGYGLRSYRMAYLKAHHTLEFMAALLSAWVGTKKESVYIQESRRCGITVGRPDVNKSDVSWSIDKSKNLRKGLLTVSGVGEKAAMTIVEERVTNGKYKSIDDMIARLPARPVSGGKDWAKKRVLSGIYEYLRDAGALKSLGVD